LVFLGQAQVIRADEGPTVTAAQADYQATLLTACQAVLVSEHI
jgi:hypothetical protein